MATAQIVAAWTENGEACLALRVSGETHLGEGVEDVEYIGRVPITDEYLALARDQQQALLVDAARRKRAEGMGAALPFSGTVEL